MYTYDQRSGLFLKPSGDVLTTGYSGRGLGRNNPIYQNVRTVGPAPRGYCKILPGVQHEKLGPIAMQLVYLQADGTVLKLLNARTEFFIHGDNAANDASHGCIIANRTAREYINTNLEIDSLLEIV